MAPQWGSRLPPHSPTMSIIPLEHVGLAPSAGGLEVLHSPWAVRLLLSHQVDTSTPRPLIQLVIRFINKLVS